MALSITTPPTTEPVALQDVKDALRLTSTADDARITRLISVARRYAEKVVNRSLVPKTYTEYFDRFPRWNDFPESYRDGGRSPLYLSAPPLIAVVSVSYLDPETMQLVTWDASQYYVSPAGMRDEATIQPNPGCDYPSTARVRGAVTVQYQAGFGYSNGTGTQITEPLDEQVAEGILRLAVHLYEHPDPVTESVLRESPVDFSTFFGAGRRRSF